VLPKNLKCHFLALAVDVFLEPFRPKDLPAPRRNGPPCSEDTSEVEHGLEHANGGVDHIPTVLNTLTLEIVLHLNGAIGEGFFKLSELAILAVGEPLLEEIPDQDKLVPPHDLSHQPQPRVLAQHGALSTDVGVMA